MADASAPAVVWRLIDARRYAEAEVACHRLLAEQPDDASLHRALARTLIGLERPAEALDEARRSVALDPNDVESHLVVTDAACQLKDQKLAMTAGRNAVAMSPHSWRTHYTLGRAFLTGKHPRAGSALTAADEAIRLSPHLADAHNLRGLSLSRLGRREEARASYLEALRLDPQHALAQNNLAVLDLRRRPGRAARGFTSAAQSDPHEQLIHRNVGVAVHVFAWRLLWVAALAGLLVGSLAAAGVDIWVRVALLVVLLGGLGWMTARFVRQLPRGVTRSPRQLWATLSGRSRLVAVIDAVVLVAVVVAAVAPAGESGVAQHLLGRVIGNLLLWTVLLAVVVRVRSWRARR